MPDIKVLALVGSLRAASINRQIAELATEAAPDGVAVTIFEGLGDLPFYNEDIDNDADVPAAVTALRSASRRSRCYSGGDPGIQRQHPGGDQERDRLALPAVRRRRAQGQAAGRDRWSLRPIRRRLGARRDPQVLRDCRSARRRVDQAVGAVRNAEWPTPASMPKWPPTCATRSANWPPKSAVSPARPSGWPPLGRFAGRIRTACLVGAGW